MCSMALVSTECWTSFNSIDSTLPRITARQACFHYACSVDYFSKAKMDHHWQLTLWNDEYQKRIPGSMCLRVLNGREPRTVVSHVLSTTSRQLQSLREGWSSPWAYGTRKEWKKAGCNATSYLQPACDLRGRVHKEGETLCLYRGKMELPDILYSPNDYIETVSPQGVPRATQCREIMCVTGVATI